jgi:acyl-homoserine lactone acylase PvdQ
LSELFGERTYELDKFFRTLGFGHRAAEIAEHADEEQTRLYNAYNAGINS